MDTDTIIPGEQVVWFKRSQRGRNINVKKYGGKLESTDGKIARVREAWSGRLVTVPYHELGRKIQDTKFSLFEKVGG